MNLTEFLNIKTNYLGIGIRTILFSGLIILIFLIEIIAFFLLYGSGEGSSRIAELWYVDLIINYFPMLIVGGILIYSVIKEYRKQEHVKFKTNLIALSIVLFLFLNRNQLENLIF